MVLTVQLPVLPHVRKFIEHKHGTEFKLSRRHNEGKMLIHMLRNQQRDERFDVRMELYSESLNVKISFDKYKERGCNNVTNRTVYDFNDFIDRTIRDEFIYFVEVLRGAQVKLTLDQMVDGFMGKYNFDDGDITPFVLKQHYYRTIRRGKEKKKTFSAVVVTPKNPA